MDHIEDIQLLMKLTGWNFEEAKRILIMENYDFGAAIKYYINEKKNVIVILDSDSESDCEIIEDIITISDDESSDCEIVEPTPEILLIDGKN